MVFSFVFGIAKAAIPDGLVYTPAGNNTGRNFDLTPAINGSGDGLNITRRETVNANWNLGVFDIPTGIYDIAVYAKVTYAPLNVIDGGMAVRLTEITSAQRPGEDWSWTPYIALTTTSYAWFELPLGTASGLTMGRCRLMPMAIMVLILIFVWI